MEAMGRMLGVLMCVVAVVAAGESWRQQVTTAIR